jgi:hypothetical protein
MSYSRVIPRDLFNDANLLKCVGSLVILADYLPSGVLSVELVDPLNEFYILQDTSDGSTFVDNIVILVHGKSIRHSRPLNSREPYALYAHWQEEIVSIFDNVGGISVEFTNLIEKIRAS